MSSVSGNDPIQSSVRGSDRIMSLTHVGTAATKTFATWQPHCSSTSSGSLHSCARFTLKMNPNNPAWCSCITQKTNCFAAAQLSVRKAATSDPPTRVHPIVGSRFPDTNPEDRYPPWLLGKWWNCCKPARWRAFVRYHSEGFPPMPHLCARLFRAEPFTCFLHT
jgi:hypothetical protein